MSSPPRKVIRVVAFGLILLASGKEAAAADDCPPGSIFRSQDGYTFCEPTVCETDVQCNPDEVCRPIPLCLQVGTLVPDAAALGDAGKRLVATQQCAPDKSCPQTTVCSALSRCVRKAAAERMGLLSTTPAASASAGAAATDAAPPKKNCSCHAVGAPATPGVELGALTALALSLLRTRRRRR